MTVPSADGAPVAPVSVVGNEWLTKREAVERVLARSPWQRDPEKGWSVPSEGGLTIPEAIGEDPAPECGVALSEKLVADFWVMAAELNAINAQFAAVEAYHRDQDEETADSSKAWAEAVEAQENAERALLSLADTAEEWRLEVERERAVEEQLAQERLDADLARHAEVKAVYEELKDQAYYDSLDYDGGRQDAYADRVWDRAEQLVDHGYDSIDVARMSEDELLRVEASLNDSSTTDDGAPPAEWYETREEAANIYGDLAGDSPAASIADSTLWEQADQLAMAGWTAAELNDIARTGEESDALVEGYDAPIPMELTEKALEALSDGLTPEGRAAVADEAAALEAIGAGIAAQAQTWSELNPGAEWASEEDAVGSAIAAAARESAAELTAGEQAREDYADRLLDEALEEDPALAGRLGLVDEDAPERYADASTVLGQQQRELDSLRANAADEGHSEEFRAQCAEAARELAEEISATPFPPAPDDTAERAYWAKVDKEFAHEKAIAEDGQRAAAAVHAAMVSYDDQMAAEHAGALDELRKEIATLAQELEEGKVPAEREHEAYTHLEHLETSLQEAEAEGDKDLRAVPADDVEGARMDWYGSLAVLSSESTAPARESGAVATLHGAESEAWGVPDGTPITELPQTYQEWLAEGKQEPTPAVEAMAQVWLQSEAAKTAAWLAEEEAELAGEREGGEDMDVVQEMSVADPDDSGPAPAEFVTGEDATEYQESYPAPWDAFTSRPDGTEEEPGKGASAAEAAVAVAHEAVQAEQQQAADVEPAAETSVPASSDSEVAE
jgi:hypothetical protein